MMAFHGLSARQTERQATGSAVCKQVRWGGGTPRRRIFNRYHVTMLVPGVKEDWA